MIESVEPGRISVILGVEEVGEMEVGGMALDVVGFGRPGVGDFVVGVSVFRIALRVVWGSVRMAVACGVVGD